MSHPFVKIKEKAHEVSDHDSCHLPSVLYPTETPSPSPKERNKEREE